MNTGHPTPLGPLPSPPPPPQKSQIPHVLAAYDKVWNNIFKCLPIIITTETYD